MEFLVEKKALGHFCRRSDLAVFMVFVVFYKENLMVERRPDDLQLKEDRVVFYGEHLLVFYGEVLIVFYGDLMVFDSE